MKMGRKREEKGGEKEHQKEINHLTFHDVSFSPLVSLYQMRFIWVWYQRRIHRISCLSSQRQTRGWSSLSFFQRQNNNFLWFFLFLGHALNHSSWDEDSFHACRGCLLYFLSFCPNNLCVGHDWLLQFSSQCMSWVVLPLFSLPSLIYHFLPFYSSLLLLVLILLLPQTNRLLISFFRSLTGHYSRLSRCISFFFILFSRVSCMKPSLVLWFLWNLSSLMFLSNEKMWEEEATKFFNVNEIRKKYNDYSIRNRKKQRQWMERFMKRKVLPSSS